MPSITIKNNPKVNTDRMMNLIQNISDSPGKCFLRFAMFIGEVLSDYEFKKSIAIQKLNHFNIAA